MAFYFHLCSHIPFAIEQRQTFPINENSIDALQKVIFTI